MKHGASQSYACAEIISAHVGMIFKIGFSPILSKLKA